MFVLVEKGVVCRFSDIVISFKIIALESVLWLGLMYVAPLLDSIQSVL